MLLFLAMRSKHTSFFHAVAVIVCSWLTFVNAQWGTPAAPTATSTTPASNSPPGPNWYEICYCPNGADSSALIQSCRTLSQSSVNNTAVGYYTNSSSTGYITWQGNTGVDLSVQYDMGCVLKYPNGMPVTIPGNLSIEINTMTSQGYNGGNPPCVGVPMFCVSVSQQYTTGQDPFFNPSSVNMPLSSVKPISTHHALPPPPAPTTSTPLPSPTPYTGPGAGRFYEICACVYTDDNAYEYYTTPVSICQALHNGTVTGPNVPRYTPSNIRVAQVNFGLGSGGPANSAQQAWWSGQKMWWRVPEDGRFTFLPWQVCARTFIRGDGTPSLNSIFENINACSNVTAPVYLNSPSCKMYALSATAGTDPWNETVAMQATLEAGYWWNNY